MKRILRILLVLAAVASIACATAAYAEVSQGQVVVVQERTLFIRTEGGVPLSFSPKFVNNGREWVIPRPINAVLPALESGEVVSVTWSWDNEGRKRITKIELQK